MKPPRLAFYFLLLFYVICIISSCSKQKIQQTTNLTISPSDNFTRYTIPTGQQYCDKSTYIPVDISELKFIVKFDSSAIYQTINPVNQYDINKLYGFSDNNQQHQLYSARFGWRWSDNALRLFGYTYNNGIRDSKELGTIEIGTDNMCSIKVGPGQYYFYLNGRTDSMRRESATPSAVGYQLFPYFGGDESAPHDINIWIKD